MLKFSSRFISDQAAQLLVIELMGCTPQIAHFCQSGKGRQNRPIIRSKVQGIGLTLGSPVSESQEF